MTINSSGITEYSATSIAQSHNITHMHNHVSKLEATEICMLSHCSHAVCLQWTLHR